MPHENIWDQTNTPAEPGEKIGHGQNKLEVSWAPFEGGNNVMIAAERPDLNARISCWSDGMGNPVERADAAFSALLDAAGVVLEGDDYEKLREKILPALGYYAGTPVTRLGIHLDREGCNRLIKVTRRARDHAFGRDE